ncbi:MAG: replication initiator protein A [Lachnospiraceae bacterium]|nr:replication initiator protein A [Lachnospiraceae bacterium]
MNEDLRFDYYYGVEGEQFSFLIVPKFLIRDERFKGLSSEAILLYSMMLERMGLSRKNGWLDEENRAYIYYSVENAMEDLGRSKPTVIKVIKELQTIGLIERRKPGQGRPAIVYVKKFATEKSPSNPDEKPEVKNLYFRKSKSFTSKGKEDLLQEVKNLNSKESGSFTSEGKEALLQEVKEIAPNNTEFKNTEENQIEESQSYQSAFSKPIRLRAAWIPEKSIDVMNEETDPVLLERRWTECVKENISYDALICDHPSDKPRIDEFVRIMVMIICFGKEPYKINGCSIPAKLVRSQFEKLNKEHIEYVLESFERTNVPMTAPDAYIVASLYSAYNTLENEIIQRVKHDMYG